jgi:hypothetical protein
MTRLQANSIRCGLLIVILVGTPVLAQSRKYTTVRPAGPQRMGFAPARFANGHHHLPRRIWNVSTGPFFVPTATAYGEYYQGTDEPAANALQSAESMNYLDSEAAKNYHEAQRLEIENGPRSLAASFEMHKMNQQFRAEARGRRLKPAELARIVHAAPPRPLPPTELDLLTGRVSWPVALRAESYAEPRADLEKLLAVRAEAGRLDTQDCRTVGELTGTMLELLKADIHSVSAADYLAAKRFLTSLAHQAIAGRPNVQIGMNR